jgi:anti-anti-sigma factor
VGLQHQLGEETPETGLRIAASAHEGWSVVVMEGELDLAESPAAARALAAAADAAREGVEVDLSELTFMGSTGVRTLIDAATDTLGRGLAFRTLPGDGAALRIIELLGVGERLGVVAPPS